MSIYQCHTGTGYDRFKMELRKVEAEVDGEEERKPCMPVIPQDVAETTQLSEVRTLLLQLNERIKKLEDSKSEPKATRHRLSEIK